MRILASLTCIVSPNHSPFLGYYASAYDIHRAPISDFFTLKGVGRDQPPYIAISGIRMMIKWLTLIKKLPKYNILLDKKFCMVKKSDVWSDIHEDKSFAWFSSAFFYLTDVS